MAKLEIELQPAEQERLHREADQEGMSVAEWARRRLLAAEPPPQATIQTAKPIWEIMAELDAIEIPAEDRARIPHDGSINYKHYLYGAAKVELPEEMI